MIEDVQHRIITKFPFEDDSGLQLGISCGVGSMRHSDSLLPLLFQSSLCDLRFLRTSSMVMARTSGLHRHPGATDIAARREGVLQGSQISWQ